MPNTFSTTINVVIPITPKPRPPCSTGNERYGGSQVNSPHQANIPKKLKSKSANVCRTKGARKIREKLSSTFFGLLGRRGLQVIQKRSTKALKARGFQPRRPVRNFRG